MTHLLRVAVVVVFIFCILAGVVLQLMMAAQTTNPRAGNRVLMGLSVDSSEFTEKGPFIGACLVEPLQPCPGGMRIPKTIS